MTLELAIVGDTYGEESSMDSVFAELSAKSKKPLKGELMKMMFKIAKTELQSLFYSPIAWLLLVVFAYQVRDDYVRDAGRHCGSAGHGIRSWEDYNHFFGDLFQECTRNPVFFIFLCSQ